MTNPQTLENHIANRRNEAHDLAADAYSFGEIAARATNTWLTSWWSDMALPVLKDGRLPLTKDLYLHAGAVGVLMLWDNAEMQDQLPPEVPNAQSAYDDFVNRIANFDLSKASDTCGAELFFQLREVYERMFVPCTHGLTNCGTGMMITGNQLPDSALDCLASLLTEFSHIIDESSEGGDQ